MLSMLLQILPGLRSRIEHVLAICQQCPAWLLLATFYAVAMQSPAVVMTSLPVAADNTSAIIMPVFHF